eukprot:m.117497 g.117497  ORF g.117497 m.117497 type:complete len:71 (+) comp10943_c1_seq2:109-321(+)
METSAMSVSSLLAVVSRIDNVCRLALWLCTLVTFSDLVANGYHNVDFATVKDRYSVYNCESGMKIELMFF